MSALSDLLDNEHAQCNGETIPHVCGMTSRRARVKQARAEHAALVARVKALEAVLEEFVRLTPCLYAMPGDRSCIDNGRDNRNCCEPCQVKRRARAALAKGPMG